MSQNERIKGSRQQLDTLARRHTKVQNGEQAIGFEQLSSLQRRRLSGLAALCMVGSFILALTVLLFTAMFLDPDAGGNRRVMLVFVVVPGALLVILTYFGVQYLIDAWTGAASVRILKLRERQKSRKGITSLVFEQVGTLSFNYDSRGSSLPETKDGHRYRVAYSPHSRMLWSITQVYR